MSAKPEFTIIGTRPPRVDAPDKVAGRAVYGTDVRLPRMAYGKVLRSPHAHARIRAIDTSRAEALPGVYAVVTGRDLGEGEDRTQRVGETSVNFKYLCDNNLASDKVLYHGHAVAAVAASSPHIAEDALRLIDVDYEVLPPVLDVLDAMRPDAPLLHEGMITESLAGASERPSNVASHERELKGDPAQGFAEADVIVEREFRTATVHQGYLEPHAATASWSPDGYLTLYATTNYPQPTWYHRLELYGTEGALSMVSGGPYQAPLTRWYLNGAWSETAPEQVESPYLSSADNFCAALRTGAPLLCDGRDGRRSQSILDAMYRSAYSDGGWVDVNPELD